MADISFKLTDYNDLLNLYKIIMEAKFHPAPVNDEVAVSPFTAKFCGELVDLLAQYEQETKGKERWSDWRMLCRRPDYRERILDQLCRYRQEKPQRWERMEAAGRQQLLRNAISPFTCSDEEFDELQRELEQRIAQRKPTSDGTLKSCNEVFLRAKAKKTYRDTAEFQTILDALRQECVKPHEGNRSVVHHDSHSDNFFCCEYDFHNKLTSWLNNPQCRSARLLDVPRCLQAHFITNQSRNLPFFKIFLILFKHDQYSRPCEVIFWLRNR